MSNVCFDPDLMRRYDRDGPRYTSYPTAVQFREGLAPDLYERTVRCSRGAQERSPLSIYVHIPFCSSPCFYCGCNKVVTRQMGRADEYWRQLTAEISMRGEYFDRTRPVEQLHFGGGTPTFLPPHRLSGLIDALARNFQLTDSAARDYSIEIDPRTVDTAFLRQIRSLGFNRISLGVQDFDPDVQHAINRVQPPDLVGDLLELARGFGFGSINFDLIYGLPRQSTSTFAATLERVAEMRPDRLAVYGYAHMPQIFKAQRQIIRSELPDAATRLALLQLAVNRLTAAGYVYIGMDHFALPADGLAQAQKNGTLQRSFQGYTTHASRDLVSLGVSAIGQVGELYIQNEKTLAKYGEAVDAGRLPAHRGVVMSEDDMLRKDVIQQIMCHGIIDLPATERRFGIEFDRYFDAALPRLRTLQSDGLIDRDETRISLTARGRLLMRNVAMAFDAYVDPAVAQPQMSRVI
ncbi:MAG: oxygen-independent coproporphyrinogen III oxidase [Steroidobacteraceae bacterium]|jgi:oxygen-independent coproporphyrinogen-3 oxidase